MYRKSLLMIAFVLFQVSGCGGGGSSNQNSSSDSSIAIEIPTDSTSDAAFEIHSIDVAQSHVYPSDDSTYELVSKKDVLIKVNTINKVGNSLVPSGRLIVENAFDNSRDVITLNRPGQILPVIPRFQPNLDNAFTASIPAHLVSRGLRITALIDGASNPTTINPRVGPERKLNITLVPIQINDIVGQVVSRSSEYILARMPFSQISTTTRMPYVSTTVKGLPSSASEWSASFSSLLGELIDLRLLDNVEKETHYFGFVPKRSPWGIAGLGVTPGRSAVGYDLPDNPVSVLETMVHELGHNLSLRHAPCGGPSSVDPSYPYANAALGSGGRFIWGYNFLQKYFVDPKNSNNHDVMSYCSGDTFSDYNYQKIQAYISSRYSSSARELKQGTKDVGSILVSGSIKGGNVSLRPLKSLLSEAQLPVPGPYTLVIEALAGVQEYHFSTFAIDHDDETQLFSFSIPNPGLINRVSVREGSHSILTKALNSKKSGLLQKSSETARVNDVSPVLAFVHDGSLIIRWNSESSPFLTVSHFDSKYTTLAQDLTGGEAILKLSPEALRSATFDFILSDGINSVRVLNFLAPNK